MFEIKRADPEWLVDKASMSSSPPVEFEGVENGADSGEA